MKKVKDLIEELSKFDQELNVVLQNAVYTDGDTIIDKVTTHYDLYESGAALIIRIEKGLD
jgi:small nuclear ribonucleoprotein (snRNP)-like protein